MADPRIANLDCDPAVGGNQTTGFTLAPAATLTCTGTYTVTQGEIDNNGGGDGDIDNTATADSEQTGPESDSASVPLDQSPALSIDKTVTEVDGDTTAPFLVDEAGDVISYSILLTNTGNQTLTGVSVADPRIANLDCDPGTAGNQTTGFTLAPAATLTCTGTYTVTQAEIDDNGGGDGDIDNTATADSGQTEPVTDSAVVPLAQSPALTISKVATESGYDSVGDVIHYTIVATNSGNTTLQSVTVTDPNAPNLVCTPANGSSLAPGASMTCTASHTITQADIDAGSFFNEACVNDGANGAAQVCDDVTTTGEQSPAIVITKDPPSQTFVSGGTAKFTIRVENTGNVTLTSVAVTDALAPGCARTSAQLGANATLAPAASFSYAVHACERDGRFHEQRHGVGDAAGGAGRDGYGYGGGGRDRSGDQYREDAGQPVVPDGRDGDVHDHGDQLGRCDADERGGHGCSGAGCARTSAQLGANATLAPAASFNYQCTLANVTADFTNSATATGTPPVGPVVTDTDTAAVDVIAPAINIEKTPDSQSFQTGGTATFTITVTNSGDVTLTSVAVTDALAPGCARTSAQLGANATLAPAASFNYQCTLANVAADFTNSATATGTPPVGPVVTDTDTAAVTVTQPPPPAAVCPTLTVSPKTMRVGKRSTITAVVTLRGKARTRVQGVRVLARGAGIRKSGVTNSQGVARISVKPARVGMIRVRITNQPGSCATRTIVVRRVQPPPEITG